MGRAILYVLYMEKMLLDRVWCLGLLSGPGYSTYVHPKLGLNLSYTVYRCMIICCSTQSSTV